MVIYLAADHAGFQLKQKIKSFLIEEKYEVKDFGALEYDKDDDYPDYIKKAAEKISENPEDRAIIFGGSGQAEAMTANRFKNVRAAVFYGPVRAQEVVEITGRKSDDLFEIIRLSREHNDSNVLSLGVRFLKPDEAIKAVDLWLTIPFPGEERHVRRIKKIDNK